jgi:hypothetical protein
MDQRWKHWYGTNRIEHFVKKQVDYWPLYVNHFISRLSNLEGLLVEETTNNDKHIILTCSFVGDRPFQVVLKKRNLLKISVRDSLDRDLAKVVMACKMAILDEDFTLTTT